jgi:ABC-type lipoprotein export system ATPase subunit
VLELLLGLGRANATTLLMVTHDLDVAGKADKLIEMKDGRIFHENA